MHLSLQNVISQTTVGSQKVLGEMTPYTHTLSPITRTGKDHRASAADFVCSRHVVHTGARRVHDVRSEPREGWAPGKARL